ncbi:MAG: ATP-binding protein, partial [Nitrospira sp.]|nr:ATP-binding protein [Nitrospira sp.]
EITEREQVTKALQQSEKRFAKAFRASPYPVGITELETGRTIDVNDACLQLFGFERNEVIGHTTLMLGIWPNPDDRRNLILQLQTGEPVLNRELNFRTKSGQIRHILISADIIELDNVRCMITVGNDITDRKQAENALQTFQDQVRQMQKMEALGQLAGGVAHDFNNLLTAILGNANIAVSKIPLDHPLHPNLSRIIEAGGRASQLVQQILAFTHQQELSRSVQPLSPIVSEVLTLLRATLPAHVMLTSTVNADTPPVQADSTQLHQVMMNLCTNAWHALKDQPGSITIDLAPANLTQPLYSFHTTLPPGLYARLSIRDTGCGMNSETISRIFDPFFTTKPVGQGTGLGLSVVHSIIQKHEGTIVVESQPNRGTTFHLYFPAAQADHADNSVEVPTIRHQEQGRHLLYLDDEAMLVELIEALFEAKGFRVTGYTDATEALNAVRAAPSQFDLVVTDYNMPKMSGLDVAQALAKIRADLPVVLVSGYLSPDAQAAAIKAEIKGIVYKPTMLQRLEDVVANILHPPPSA